MKITSIEQLKNAPSGWCIYDHELYSYYIDQFGLVLKGLNQELGELTLTNKKLEKCNIETVRIKKHDRVYAWMDGTRPEYPRMRYYKEYSLGHKIYFSDLNDENEKLSVTYDNVEPLSIEDVEPTPEELPTDEEILSHVWRDGCNTERYLLFLHKVNSATFKTSCGLHAKREWFKNRKKIRIADED